MRFVETDLEKGEFLDAWNSFPCIVFPIWEDLEKHPMNNSLSFLYVKFPIGSWVVSFSHNDCKSIYVDLSGSTQQKYVYNKKGLLQTDLNIQNLVDIETILFFELYDVYPNGLEINELDDLTNFYGRNGYRDNLGKIIPIMRFGEVIEHILIGVSKNLPLNDIIGKNWVNDTMIPTLSEVERNGIRVDTEKFKDRWSDSQHHKHLNGDIIYTEYNPYTLTSRPSNRHGGINFGALNKSDGTRDVFVPRDGNTFVQFDYDAYHIRLIGKLIGYELPKTSAHQWLADQYGVDYEEAKGRTFTNLYGEISEKDKSIEFFRLTDEYIQQMWKETLECGSFYTIRGRRIYLEWIDNPTPQKIFNYLLQSMETELNIEVMKELFESGYGDNMVLYQYDAFIFDLSPDDIRKKITEIKDILEKFGFPVKGTYGDSYGKL